MIWTQLGSLVSQFKLGTRSRILCAVLLSTAALSLGSENSTVLEPKPDAIPSSYFAMNILFHPLNHVSWPTVPLGGWRMAHVNWADIQIEKNHWYFDLLDKYVNWSQEHHTEVLMPLTYTPRWASSTPDAPTDVEVGNPPGLSGAPVDMENWRIYVRTLATRYKGRIHIWEIWNEPNRRQSWTGSVDTLVEMTREASEILKEVDPDNRVISPPITGFYGLPFLDKFFHQGGGKYVDVIGYHFYVGHEDPPEVMVSLIDKVKVMTRRYGLDSKPLWDTEAGWLGPNSLSPELSAAYVSRSYILNWADGVSRFYWYAWENHHDTQIELTERDNVSLTPAGKAFATIQAWMTGAVMTRCAGSSDGTWICDLRNKNGAFHIVWNTKGSTVFPLPEEWHARNAKALAGNKAAIQEKSIAIGVQPVLIQ